MWLLKACFLLILPDPVTVKRFFALEFVFIFGISLFFKSELSIYILDKKRTSYFFFGLIITIIRFPSNFGICSNAPTSASS
jgi:hypothetical protein